MFHVLNNWRVRQGYGASSDAAGNNGLFMMPGARQPLLAIQASDGGGWEHVSVSVPGTHTTPTWEEMDFVKRLFWDDTDCVAQLHVPRKDWVNFHPYTLHLWRQIGNEWAQPPSITVGPKTYEPDDSPAPMPRAGYAPGTDPAPIPATTPSAAEAPPMTSGGGGDFAGAGASGSWDDDKSDKGSSSSSSDSSSSSSDSSSSSSDSGSSSSSSD